MSKKCSVSLLGFGLLLLLATSCRSTGKNGSLSVNALFTDHMVLQQQTEVAFWGSYAPKGEVRIAGSWGKESTAIADDKGNWALHLATPEAGGPFTVDIITRDTTIALADVMIGEVWLASGQSNMEMPLSGWPPNDTILNSAAEIQQADFSGIRMFTVTRNCLPDPTMDIVGTWEVASPETVGAFSASAYFFAKRLHRELNVPVGIIHSSWGGTPAEAWTSQEKLKTLGDFDETMAEIQDPAPRNITKAWFDRWETLEIPQTTEEWDSANFSDSGVEASGFDDAGWPVIGLPGTFDNLETGTFDGIAWFRKKINVTDVSSDYTLRIGAIDDMDVTYVNGQQIGKMMGSGKWNVARIYTIPKSVLTQGENTLAIRVVDTGGGGSFTGPFEMTNASGKTVSLDGDWKFLPRAEIFENLFYLYDYRTFDLGQRPEIHTFNANLPTVLYNGMISPLIPYTIKGAIWYQGEANVGRAEQYKRLFPAMITDWRERWGNDFPFYFVQIAPFRYNGSPDAGQDVSQLLRDAQRDALKTPRTGMVVTMDIGNFINIHPANKPDVGARLAGLALANDYGKNLVASGPLFKSLEISGNILILDFEHKGSGLMTHGDLTGFEIAGADKNFVPAEAKIFDDKIQVAASTVSEPLYARYAWRDNGVATLFNKEGLPASSFTTEQ